MKEHFIPREEIIEHLKRILEESSHDLKRAKHPRNKRRIQSQITFFGSILHHIGKGE